MLSSGAEPADDSDVESTRRSEDPSRERIRTCPAASGSTPPARARNHPNEALTCTKYTNAAPPRRERCFLCEFVPSAPLIDDPVAAGGFFGGGASALDPLAHPERNIVSRIKQYWAKNCEALDFYVLARDCARMFQSQYEANFAPPPSIDSSGNEPDAPCVCDAPMILAHFLEHESTRFTRRARTKRMQAWTYEMAVANKRAVFVEGRHGKRLPCPERVKLHLTLVRKMIELDEHEDKMDKQEAKNA